MSIRQSHRCPKYRIENLLHVGVGLRTHLKVVLGGNLVLLTPRQHLVSGDVAIRLAVAFGADQHERRFAPEGRLRLEQKFALPNAQILEGRAVA